MAYNQKKGSSEKLGTATGDTVIRFGKYSGTRLADIPAYWLLWLAEQDWSEKFSDIREYIEKNRNRLEEEKDREGRNRRGEQEDDEEESGSDSSNLFLTDDDIPF